MARTEFGYERTSCACKNCTTNCRFMPGFLIPSDLERLVPKEFIEQENIFAICDWAESNLLASPGATAIRAGEIIRIRTLVPATKPDGSCMNLSEQGLCQIHENAPFGCAFFDCGPERGNLSQKGLREVMRAWEVPSLYSFVWLYLDEVGKRQHGPNVLRARMQEAINKSLGTFDPTKKTG